MGEEELEWGIGKGRVKFISRLVNQVRVAYVKSKRQKQIELLEDYITMLDALWLEVEHYTDHEKIKIGEREKKVDKWLEYLQNRVDTSEMSPAEFRDVLETARSVDRAVNAFRIETGLDIPKSQKVDPENAAIAGLK